MDIGVKLLGCTSALLMLALVGCQAHVGTNTTTGAMPLSEQSALNANFIVAMPPDKWVNTGKEFDFSIDNSGNGQEDTNFFKLSRGDGKHLYTRHGAFKLDSNGSIVHENGMFLVPVVTLPPQAKDIHLRSDGIILFRLPGNDEYSLEAGPIQVARFINPAGLEAIGGGFYRATAKSGGSPWMDSPEGKRTGRIYQGFLEPVEPIPQ